MKYEALLITYQGVWKSKQFYQQNKLVLARAYSRWWATKLTRIAFLTQNPTVLIQFFLYLYKDRHYWQKWKIPPESWWEKIPQKRDINDYTQQVWFSDYVFNKKLIRNQDFIVWCILCMKYCKQIRNRIAHLLFKICCKQTKLILHCNFKTCQELILVLAL